MPFKLCCLVKTYLLPAQVPQFEVQIRSLVIEQTEENHVRGNTEITLAMLPPRKLQTHMLKAAVLQPFTHSGLKFPEPGPQSEMMELQCKLSLKPQFVVRLQEAVKRQVSSSQTEGV